jgi:IMP cyclohydrolase
MRVGDREIDVILTVEDKRFGKPWITYKVVKSIDKSVVTEGKCKDFTTIRGIYKELMDGYGSDKVLLLQK